MNINHLAIFDAVAQTGGVSSAAKRLLVSQPAVSKQLKDFERALGVPLFERRSKPLKLTAPGKVMAPYARRIFALAEEAEQAVDDLQHLRRGRLAVGASTTIGVYLLPDLLVKFRNRFPGISLRVEIENSNILRRRLEEHSLDLGLSEAVIRSPKLKSIKFMQQEFVAISSPGHPLARRRRVSLEAFCKESLIFRDAGANTQSFIENTLADRGHAVRPALTLGSTEAVKSAVAAGLGCAIVPRLTIDLELAAGRLALVKLAGPPIHRPVYQYRSINRHESKAARAFHCLLEHAARGTLPPLEMQAKP